MGAAAVGEVDLGLTGSARRHTSIAVTRSSAAIIEPTRPNDRPRKLSYGESVSGHCHGVRRVWSLVLDT